MRHQTNVLVVDSQELYKVVTPVIQEELHPKQIMHCETAAEAIKAINGEIKFDMILAFWPITGASFINAVRNSTINHNCPIIITAEDDNDEFLGKVIRSGATDLLVKPFLMKGLVAKIQHINQGIERRRHHRVVLPTRLMVSAEISDRTEGDRQAQLEMVNISADGCQVKAPTSCNTRVYDKAKLEFSFQGSDFELNSHLLRLEADPQTPHGGAFMYATFLFHDMSEEVRDSLNQMLDELSEYEQP